MNFSLKKNLQTLTVLLFANAMNILFIGMRILGIVIIRPVIIYEYLLIPLLIALRAPALLIWIAFLIILLVDVLSQISFIYLFNVPDFIKSLEFYSLYSFSLAQYLIAISSLLLLYLVYVVINKLSNSIQHTGRLLISTFVLFFSIVILDLITGPNLFSQKAIYISDFNLGGTNLKKDVLLGITSASSKPKSLTFSATFKTFEKDTMGNQFLIILESWGLPSDTTEWNRLKKEINKRASTRNWKTDFGYSPFRNSTTSGELREIFKMRGDYNYFLNPDSAKSFQSIFDIKKQQSYYSVAAHSFSGKMFKRSIWWRNIGIDSIFFLEDIMKKNILSEKQLNYATAFPSINDEETFMFLNGINNDQKKFAYLLTENTHLPFYQKFPSNNGLINFKEKLSEEGNSQMIRIQELIFYFIENLNPGWSKVLIVGDHMPPYTKIADRSFYSQDQVPYVILSRQP
jgi:hypothetical protein